MIGTTVRVRWSGKIGRVLVPRVRRRRGSEGPPGVLIVLAPFVPVWAEDGEIITGLEVICAPEDLETLPPQP